jgi:hypothetical protein
MKEIGFQRAQGASSHVFEMIYGLGLGCFKVLKLSRKDIAENPFPSGYQKQ